MLWIIVAGVAGLGPVCWQLSPSFRYFFKMSIYYVFTMFMSATVAMPLMLPFGRNPDNARIVSWVICTFASWTGIEFDIRGKEHLDNDDPCVIVANHQSSIDVLGVFTVLPRRVVGMMKKAIMYFGPVGVSNYLIGSVFVDRANSNDARKVMDKVAQEIRDTKVKLWVFPEGTRNHGPGLLPFKKGGFHLAVQAKIPIVPVVFSYYYPFYSKPERRFEMGGKIIVQILPKIETTDLSKEDVTKLSESTRDLMLETLAKISPEAEAWFKNS